MSHWRYVMSRERDDIDEGVAEDRYAIREYYELVDGEGDVERLWTLSPVSPSGDNATDLALDLTRMLMALNSGEMLDLTLDEPAIVQRARPCPYCNAGWDVGCGDDACCKPGPCGVCDQWASK